MVPRLWPYPAMAMGSGARCKCRRQGAVDAALVAGRSPPRQMVAQAPLEDKCLHDTFGISVEAAQVFLVRRECDCHCDLCNSSRATGAGSGDRDESEMTAGGLNHFSAHSIAPDPDMKQVGYRTPTLHAV